MTARKPPPARTLVAEALKSNDRRVSLTALRDQLAERLDETSSARDAAAITRQLSLIVTELAGMKSGPSKRDELRLKRAARLAAGAARLAAAPESNVD